MTPKKTLSTLIIRAMVESDLLAVEALDRLCFNDPWPNGSYAYELKPGSPNVCLVAVDVSNEEVQNIIGVIVVWLIVDEAHIGTIAVNPDYRHLGVGRKLLAEALLRAVAQGAISSLLEVRAGNQAALALYYGLGYVTVGLRAGYYADNHEDALLLTWQSIDKAKLAELVG
jgi:ribosomal-protein-alanine N-acetyltransferase